MYNYTNSQAHTNSARFNNPATSTRMFIIFLNHYFYFIFRVMDQRPLSACIAACEDATDLMGVLCGMIELQQQLQMTLLRDGLMAAQQITTVAMERSATPWGPKPRNILDFRRLQPATFVSTEKPLEAEQLI